MTHASPFARLRPRNLRTRYRPAGLLGAGAAHCAPWAAVLLIIGFFVLLSARLVLRHGLVIDLPAAPAAAGTAAGRTAVILSLESPGSAERREMVFFNDMPFALDQPDACERLRAELARSAGRGSDPALLVEADRRVKYDTLARVFRIAHEAGVRRVNLATVPEPAKEAPAP